MKKTIILLIISMLLILVNVKTNAQTCILNMSDQFGSATCNLHCWARATKNVLYYYGNTNLQNIEIIDYARTEGFLEDCINCASYACDVCTVTPDTCCKTLNTEHIVDILENFGEIYSYIEADYLNSTFLYSQFILGKPVIIHATGHVFVAFGISGSNVYVLDGGEEVIRNISNIAPGRTWESTIVMNNNNNCSYTNNISNVLRDVGRTFLASNTLTLSKTILAHAGYTTTLKAENKVQLCEGTEIRKNSALVIQSGYNFCP